MTLSLLPAAFVHPGDLLECCDGIWRPVKAIDRQAGRLYFLFGDARDTRTGLIDDLVCVARQE